MSEIDIRIEQIEGKWRWIVYVDGSPRRYSLRRYETKRGAIQGARMSYGRHQTVKIS